MGEGIGSLGCLSMVPVSPTHGRGAIEPIWTFLLLCKASLNPVDIAQGAIRSSSSVDVFVYSMASFPFHSRE